VSEFFEPPPPEESERPPRQRMPPWVSAPSGTLPGGVPLDLVLARTEQVGVCLTGLAAYPEGFELDLITMASNDRDDLDPHLFGRPGMRGRRLNGELEAGGGIPPEMLRFGVEFADGTKATNTAGRIRGLREEPPPGPVLTPGGGGGGGGNWRQTVWVWPLPPPGRMAFVCEWPAGGIPLTRHELDAQLILDAASRAQVFFADDEISGPPGVVTVVSARHSKGE
jgi:hypothetical protein